MTCTPIPRKSKRHTKRRTERWYGNHPECPRHPLKTKQKKKPLFDRIAEFLTTLLEQPKGKYRRGRIIYTEDLHVPAPGPNRHERRRSAAKRRTK